MPGARPAAIIEIVRSIVVAAVLTLAVPTGLELVGVLSPSYLVEGGALILRRHSFHFEPGITELSVLTLNLAVIVSAALYAGRISDDLFSAMEQFITRGWHLGQIVQKPRVPEWIDFSRRRQHLT